MHFDLHRVSRSLTTLAAASALLVACGGDDGPSGPTANSVAKVLESLRLEGGANAALRTGDVPPPSGGPVASVTMSDAIAQGGTSEVVVSSATAFRRIFVTIDGRDGYYEVTLPADATSATLLATFGVNESGDVNVNYSVATSSGAVGAASTAAVNIVDVGTGDVQVTLSWNSPADLDLHVVEPGSGEEIYYGNDVSATGGTLDLDSNADCLTDDKRAENITWNTAPPRGTYTVRVDHYKNCGATSSDYVVTVRQKGKATQTFTGTFTGLGDEGGLGSGRLITQFTY